MPIVAYAVRIDMECRSCLTPVAVAGHTREVRCPGCETAIPLDAEFLEDALSDLAHRDQLEPDLCRVTSGMTAITWYRTSYCLQAPCCDCGRPLDLGVVARAPQAMSDLSILCPDCRVTTVVRRLAPEAMGHDRARGLLLEHRGAPRLTGGGAICVWCPSEGCRDVMEVTEYTPTITCETCAQPFPLDRDRWDRMTTLAGAKHFYVLLEEPEPPPPLIRTAIPLKLGWVISSAVMPRLMPLVIVLALVVALGLPSEHATAAAITAIAIGGILVLIVAINLPGFLRTLMSDRNIVLDEHELHVPVIRLFQRRPWTVAYHDLVSFTDQRESGSSTRLVLALRDGRTHEFSASVVADRYALIAAIDRRIKNAQR